MVACAGGARARDSVAPEREGGVWDSGGEGVYYLNRVSVINHNEKSLDPEGCSQLLTLSILLGQIRV